MKGFESNKTIKELGIDTKRKFVVIGDNFIFNKGDILQLIEDDDSFNPRFRRISDGKLSYFYLEDLSYYEEQKNQEDKAYFYVFVPGGHAPRVKHTLESAEKEAQRLAIKENEEVVILQALKSYKPDIKPLIETKFI